VRIIADEIRERDLIETTDTTDESLGRNKAMVDVWAAISTMIRHRRGLLWQNDQLYLSVDELSKSLRGI